MVAVPEVGLVNPTIIRIAVDLPAPFGPRKPVTRPGVQSKEMSSTARKSRYTFVRFWTLIMAPILPYAAKLLADCPQAKQSFENIAELSFKARRIVGRIVDS